MLNIFERLSLANTTIEYIPKKPVICNTYEEWLEAVKNRDICMQEVPLEFQTEEMMHLELQNTDQLHRIPEKFRTEEICLKFVKIHEHNFKHVPKELKTEEFLIKCVQIDGDILKYLKRNERTETICREAIKNNPKAFNYLSRKKFPTLYEEESLRRL